MGKITTQTAAEKAESDPAFKRLLVNTPNAADILQMTHSQILRHINDLKKRISNFEKIADEMRSVKNGIKVQNSYFEKNHVPYHKVTNDDDQVVFIREQVSAHGNKYSVQLDRPGGKIVETFEAWGSTAAKLLGAVYDKHRRGGYHK